MCHLYVKVSGQFLTKIMRFTGPEEFHEVLGPVPRRSITPNRGLSWNFPASL